MLSKNQLDIENDQDYLAAVGGIVSLSAFLKNIAQAMIDLKYPMPEPEPEKEKDKDKDKEKKKKKKGEAEAVAAEDDGK